MKNKLFSPARKEAGFTLIELLTVIVIIGILAAIAIPVFTSQRARAQDSQTVSDVRNAAIAAESFLVDKNNKLSDLSKTNIEFASSKNVSWEISGSNTLGGYCIVAKNTAGKKYATDATALTYDSLAGGVGKSGVACTTGNTPTPSGSTAVGSDVTTPVTYTPTTFNATSTGSTGSLQTFTASAAGTYKIEAFGAAGGGGYNGYVGGKGAYATGVFSLNSGQTITMLVGQKGSQNSYYVGGGGGTFVATNGTSSATQLVVAGGGGGGALGNGGNASITTTGGSSPEVGGGVNGAGGAGYYAGGGGGITSGGQTGWATGGGVFPGNGGEGSINNNSPVAGGYGGGGAATTYTGSGGGGGGYSGGGGGTTYGGGGGSYVAPTFNGSTVTATELNSSTKGNTGAGKVIITRIS